jgi:glutaredoxin
MLFLLKHRHLLINAALLTSMLANVQAIAQTTYQWVDPKTGTTVISDQAPPPGVKQVTRRGSEESTLPQVPYAIRQASEKFPIILYTSTNCIEVCNQARALLNGRGAPFTEKMLKTQEDNDELSKQMNGETPIPSLFVGSQRFKGFEAGSWNNLLDLAGYPKTAPYGSKPSGIFTK